jgi:hypothetical protein
MNPDKRHTLEDWSQAGSSPSVDAPGSLLRNAPSAGFALRGGTSGLIGER